METDEKKDKYDGEEDEEEEKRSREEDLKKETRLTCNSGGRYRTRQPRHSSHPGVCTPQKKHRENENVAFTHIRERRITCPVPSLSFSSQRVFLSHSYLKLLLLQDEKKEE